MKEVRRLKDFAVFGGPPAFEQLFHVGRPNIGDRERLLTRINDLLDRRWLSNHGPYVQELEQRIAEMLSVKHCILTCNATIALEIAIRAIGLKGEVIVPSFTFIATAHALQWQGITPIFCDIDPETHNIDPIQAKNLITPQTSGILGVHLWGRACDITALTNIANQYNLKLLFDAAHAFSCSYQGRMIGNFGSAEVFSFHATKFFNTFEGGAITTNDDDLAARIRLMKNFGFSGHDNVIHIGTNGKMSEVSAAMGLTSLESLDEFVSVNYNNYLSYKDSLSDIPGIGLITYDPSERNNYQYIVLEVDDMKAGITRDQLMQVLWGENVLARRYFYPGCHRMEPYRSSFSHIPQLPKTEWLSQRILSLPTGTSVAKKDIETICYLIKMASQYSAEIHNSLPLWKHL